MLRNRNERLETPEEYIIGYLDANKSEIVVNNIRPTKNRETGGLCVELFVPYPGNRKHE